MKMEKFNMSIGNTVSGAEFSVVGYRIGKGKPDTYIQGGLHGGEITYGVFTELFNRLKNINLKGTLTLVPICNPISWNQRIYYWTSGKFYFGTGMDFNWVFPGKSDGTTEQRIAHMIFNEAKSHDFVIDLHTANWCKPYGYMFHEEDVKYGKIGGLKLARLRANLLQLEESLGLCTLNGALDKIGIPSIAFELGGHNTFNEKHNKETCDAVMNILTDRGHFNFKGKKFTKGEYYFTESKIYYAPTSGFVEYTVPFEQKIKKGDELYKLYSATDPRDTISIKAEEDSVMFLRARTHIAEVGDYVAEVIPMDQLHKYPK